MKTDREHVFEAFKLYKEKYNREYITAIRQHDYYRAAELTYMLEEIQQIEQAVYAFFEGRG